MCEKISRQWFDPVRRVLLREWDPLCVKCRKMYDEDAEDEYDGYARGIVDLLVNGVSFEEMLSYLEWAETKNMELPFSPETARRTAKLIFDTVINKRG